MPLEGLYVVIMNLLSVLVHERYFDTGFLPSDFLTLPEHLIFCFAFSKASLALPPLVPSLSQNFLEYPSNALLTTSILFEECFP